MTAFADVPMFEVDTPPVKTPRRPKSNGRPKWTRYQTKTPTKCDDCMLLLAQTNGQAPVARYAQFKRVADGTDLLLCIAHAQDRRDEDGLEPLEP